ncbi:MAG: TetR/AcrR family transcriptional regulator [Candidatus Heimdallarchaeota archaeon]|nr:TetR/AcrR family transcriptional regulator [Candidatus Heimdallarchaeota archaeon]
MSKNINDEDLKIPTKEKILLAASELFLKKDFKTVSTQEIAKAAGVAKGTVFLHYTNKHLLALTVLEAVMQKMTSEFYEMIANMAPEEIIISMINYTMDIVESSAGFNQLLIQVLADIDSLSKNPQNDGERLIQQEVMKIEALLIGYIAEFADIFEQMGFENPQAHSRIFIGMLDGLGLQISLNPKPDKKLMKELTESMIKLFTQR